MRAVLLALAATLVVAPAATPALTTPAPAPVTAGPERAGVPTDGPDVVLLGTTGLQWDDVDPTTTPALADLLARGAVGSTAVRAVRTAACPADGWLSLSAATRAGDIALTPDDGVPLLPVGTCRTLDEPVDGHVPAWDVFTSDEARSSYGSVPGTLGDALVAAGRTTAALGPGAAVALASTDGTLTGTYSPLDPDDGTLPSAVGAALTSADVVVVDLGVVRGTDADERATDVARAERTAAAVRDALDALAPGGPSEPGEEGVPEPDARDGSGTPASSAVDAGPRPTLLVASLADASAVPRLQVGGASGPGVGDPAPGSPLTSASTRQPGYVITADWARTVLEVAGAADGVRSTGAPVHGDGTARPFSDAVADLRDDSLRTVAVRSLVSPHYVGYGLLVLVPVLVAGVVVRRRAQHGPSPRTTRAVHVASAVGASVPVAATLAALVPWWRTPLPWVALVVVTVGLAALVAALALLPAVRRAPLGPAGVVAGATALVIVADVVVGAPLQLNGVIGTQALVAGRFYGVNNTSFALLAVATLVAAVALAEPLAVRGRRRLAGLVVLVLGLAVVAVDGLPSLGADFGGPPALVPGVALAALLVAGVRLTWRRVLGVLGAGAAVVAVFALLDWRRPAASRTHLGAFVQQVLDGDGLDVVVRKLSQNVGPLVSSPLAVAGVVAVVALLWLGVRRGVLPTEPVREAVADVPVLRAALLAVCLTLALGFAVNDSGILVPLVGLALVVPLVLLVWTGRLLAPASPHPVEPR